MEDESKDMREVGNAVTGGGNEGSGGGGEEEGERVRTLFVSGIPMDVTTREMYLLFRACEGYEDNTIKPSPKGTVAFVRFANADLALKAEAEMDGVIMDPATERRINVEMAKHDMRGPAIKRSAGGYDMMEEPDLKRRKGPAPYGHPGSLMGYGPPGPPQPSYGSVPPVAAPAYGMDHWAPQPPVSYSSSYSSGGGGGGHSSGHAQRTLFVSNLLFETREDELYAAFGTLPGFRRLRLQSSSGSSPVAFVEFEDGETARQGLETIRLMTLPCCLNGQPLRAEFARKEMTGGRQGDAPTSSSYQSSSNYYGSPSGGYGVASSSYSAPPPSSYYAAPAAPAYPQQQQPSPYQYGGGSGYSGYR